VPPWRSRSFVELHLLDAPPDLSKVYTERFLAAE
jgi:hypothetical protein